MGLTWTRFERVVSVETLKDTHVPARGHFSLQIKEQSFSVDGQDLFHTHRQQAGSILYVVVRSSAEYPARYGDSVPSLLIRTTYSVTYQGYMGPPGRQRPGSERGQLLNWSNPPSLTLQKNKLIS